MASLVLMMNFGKFSEQAQRTGREQTRPNPDRQKI